MTAKRNKSAPTLYRYLMDSGHSGGDRLLLEGVKHQCGAKGHARFWANSRLLGDNFQESGLTVHNRNLWWHRTPLMDENAVYPPLPETTASIIPTARSNVPLELSPAQAIASHSVGPRCHRDLIWGRPQKRYSGCRIAPAKSPPYPCETSASLSQQFRSRVLVGWGRYCGQIRHDSRNLIHYPPFLPLTR
jgi:hypothetical protein